MGQFNLVTKCQGALKTTKTRFSQALSDSKPDREVWGQNRGDRN
ncbi:MAG TPA: hypothetical protein P5106_07345 [Caldisericia bacterium]|nr:hypothetical protein [Caldisericia bacterium]